MLSTILSPASMTWKTKSQQLEYEKRKRLKFHHSVEKTCNGISPERKHTQLHVRSVSTILLPVSILKKPQKPANKTRKRVQFHHSVKTWDGISPERKRNKQLHMQLQSCCNYHVQLERLFSDFWSEECRLTALTELVLQRNSTVLAALCCHIIILIRRIERCSSAEISVPLLQSGGEKQIALTKAHLYHVRQLLLHVCHAHNKCVRICTATAAQEEKCADLNQSMASS